jgi:hypothetical protein
MKLLLAVPNRAYIVLPLQIIQAYTKMVILAKQISWSLCWQGKIILLRNQTSPYFFLFHEMQIQRVISVFLRCQVDVLCKTDALFECDEMKTMENRVI